MAIPVRQLVQRIHDAPVRVVLAVTGGGSRAIGQLLEVPGASRTLLEAVVPYSAAAMTDWLGGRPDQFCSEPTGRAMAMAAYLRACRYREREGEAPAEPVEPRDAIRLGRSLALPSTSPSRRGAGFLRRGRGGVHGKPGQRSARSAGRIEIHVALQTADATVSRSLELVKGRRTRAEEERVAASLVLNAVAEACGLDERLDLGLLAEERLDERRVVAPRSWQELLAGSAEMVEVGGAARPADRAARTVFPGAFHPLHAGHRRMAEIAAAELGVPVEFEISIVNVDKPPLDFIEIEHRVSQFAPQQLVWLTRAATFEEKSARFPGVTFVVGVDTMRRIADPPLPRRRPRRRGRPPWSGSPPADAGSWCSAASGKAGSSDWRTSICRRASAASAAGSPPRCSAKTSRPPPCAGKRDGREAGLSAFSR